MPPTDILTPTGKNLCERHAVDIITHRGYMMMGWKGVSVKVRDRQADRQADRQTDRQAGRQAGRQTWSAALAPPTPSDRPRFKAAAHVVPTWPMWKGREGWGNQTDLRQEMRAEKEAQTKGTCVVV